MKGFNNSENLNKSLKDERKKLMSELHDLGGKIRKLQKKHDDKIKEIHKIEDEIAKKEDHKK